MHCRSSYEQVKLVNSLACVFKIIAYLSVFFERWNIEMQTQVSSRYFDAFTMSLRF